MEACCLPLALFVLVCPAVAQKGKIEEFVVDVQEITKTNAECKEIVKKHQETNANLTSSINILQETVKFLKEKNAALETKNDALNLTLATMQGRHCDGDIWGCQTL